MTGPVTAEVLAFRDDLVRAISNGSFGKHYEAANAFMASHVEPLLAALQQVTAERDKARADLKAAEDSNDALNEKLSALAPHGSCACSYDKPGDVCMHHSPALATATSELARLRAEGEAKDRTLKLLLPFVDYAAGEGLMFVETEGGEHPEMDAADIAGFAAQALGLELGSDAYLALLSASYAAIRAARAATAREG